MATKQELSAAYNESTERVYRILDEDGVNMADATVRLTALGWVYQDNVDGFELLSADDAARLIDG